MELIDELPTGPRSTSPATFDEDGDEWLEAFNACVPQLNRFIRFAIAMNLLGMSFTFKSATGDADPGAGCLGLNNASAPSATQVFVDNLDSTGADASAYLATFDDSTSTVRGTLVLCKAGDLSKFLRFNITGASTAASGYYKLSVTPAGGSASMPFADGDEVVAFFQRTGDGVVTSGIPSRAYTVPVTVTPSAGTATIDASQSNVFYMATLSANVTTMTVNNPADGQTISVRVPQDGTGGRTCAVPSGAKIDGTQITTANRVAVLTMQYVGGSVARWEGAWSQVPA